MSWSFSAHIILISVPELSHILNVFILYVTFSSVLFAVLYLVVIPIVFWLLLAKKEIVFCGLSSAKLPSAFHVPTSSGRYIEASAWFSILRNTAKCCATDMVEVLVVKNSVAINVRRLCCMIVLRLFRHR